MGAHGYTVTYKVADQSKVREKWDCQVEQDAYESGRDAYAGNATTMNGPVEFHDQRFASQEEAYEWVLDNHEKWSGPLACSFYLPVKQTEAQKRKVEKATEKFYEAEKKEREVKTSIRDAFVVRKSTYVGCKSCGSKLSHEHLVKRNRGGLPTCPLCLELLLSDTDKARIESHAKKVKRARDEIGEAKKTKASKEIGWVVGGWAAC